MSLNVSKYATQITSPFRYQIVITVFHYINSYAVVSPAGTRRKGRLKSAIYRTTRNRPAQKLQHIKNDHHTNLFDRAASRQYDVFSVSQYASGISHHTYRVTGAAIKSKEAGSLVANITNSLSDYRGPATWLQLSLTCIPGQRTMSTLMPGQYR